MGKINLDQIFLSWHKYESTARKDEEVLNNGEEEAVFEALQPHPNLKTLAIDQYFGVKLPPWMGGGDPLCLPNLVFMHLNDCPKCEQLVGFGKLPSLKKLFLKNMDGIKCLGNEFYYNNNNSNNTGGEIVVLFPSLKELALVDMGALEEWVDVSPPPTLACFPCLEKIEIYRCPNLRTTPTATTHFPSLKKLVLQEINGRLVMPLITANSLESVELVKISELMFLPYRCLLQGTKVKVLKVFDCLDFQGFKVDDHQNEEEEGGGGFTSSLRILSLLRLPALKFLPDIQSFTSLERLYIKDCKSLKTIPEDLGCLSSSLEHLKLVQIRNVKEVDHFEWRK